MKPLRWPAGALRVAAACLALGGGALAQPQEVNRDAQVLQEFDTRVDDYMKLHKQIEKQVPPLSETEDPGKIAASQDALAAGIRAARRNAKPGDIFTPEIRKLLRRLMYPETTGRDGANTKQLMKEDAPASIRLEVNATYPESEPLPTVPPNVLASLPKLPEELEYRVVGRHLILRDVHANVIVDFLPNAIR